MDWSFPCVHSTTSRRCKASVLTKKHAALLSQLRDWQLFGLDDLPQDASRASHWKYITGLNPWRPARVSMLTAALLGVPQLLHFDPQSVVARNIGSHSPRTRGNPI
jgi:hypothetical protein